MEPRELQNYEFSMAEPLRGTVPERDFEGFEAAAFAAVEENTTVDKMVSMGEGMGLEVDSGVVEELVENHRIELLRKSLHTFRMNYQLIFLKNSLLRKKKDLKIFLVL